MTNSIEAKASHSFASPLRTFDEESASWGDDLMPVQFYPAASATPCERLLGAILEDAIRCFQKNCAAQSIKRQIMFREAEAWLFDSHGLGFMSCQTVCESLAIDPIQLRRYLRKWKLNKQAGLKAPLLGRVRLAYTNPSRMTSLKPGRKLRASVSI